MILINFSRWGSSSGPLFTRRRIYWNGATWTPFVALSFRYLG